MTTEKGRKPPTKSLTNREGITFWEWFRAANFARQQPLGLEVAQRAWMRGEDPTEYAAV